MTDELYRILRVSRHDREGQWVSLPMSKEDADCNARDLSSSLGINSDEIYYLVKPASDMPEGQKWKCEHCRDCRLVIEIASSSRATPIHFPNGNHSYMRTGFQVGPCIRFELCPKCMQLPGTDESRVAAGDYVRASGDVICDQCNREYWRHGRVVGHEYLHKICGGLLVKL
jgi:hypothetical protein